MKTNIFSFLTLAAVSLALGSCSDNWEPASSATGELNLKSLAVEVTDETTVVSRADVRAEHDLSHFLVYIINADNEIVKTWEFGSMPDIFSFPVGDYTVKVVSHEIEKAAWDAPYYEGSQTFSIEDKKITNIGTVTCSFASLKVTVKFDEALSAAMQNDYEVTVVANNEGRLVFTPSETRAAYFEVPDVEGNPHTLAATFTGTVNGYSETVSKTFDNIKRGEHYIITFKFRTNNLEPDEETGQIDPSSSIIDAEITNENISGDDVNNDEEVIDNDGTHNKEEFVEEVDSKYDPSAGTITISAPAGLASVKVAVAADSNAEFNAEFASLNGADLATANFSKYGLPTGFAGSTSLTINLATLIEAAQEFEGEHSFSFTASDVEGAVSDPVTLSVKGKGTVEPITFESALRFGVELDPSKETDGKVIISAAAGIAHLVVDINSDNEDFAGVTGPISGQDFAHPDPAVQPTLTGFGLSNGDQVLNQTSVVFDITTFLSEAFLPSFPGRHQFDIEVTDNDNNKNSITLIFVVK